MYAHANNRDFAGFPNDVTPHRLLVGNIVTTHPHCLANSVHCHCRSEGVVCGAAINRLLAVYRNNGHVEIGLSISYGFAVGKPYPTVRPEIARSVDLKEPQG